MFAAAAFAERCAVLLELDAPPAAEVYAAQTAAKANPSRKTAAVQQCLAEIEHAQEQLLAVLTAKNDSVQVLYSVQRVCNGIAVRIDAERQEELLSLPRVRAVRPLRRFRVNTSTSMPFLGLPALWDGTGLNLTGQGVSIGVIDTGIDYLHPDFGGSGKPAEYDANDPLVIGDASFPSVKVAGGYDFVGENYDPDDRRNDDPIPDPDPMDSLGHGTHVAGIAAGYGVTGNGQTYAAGYGPLTPFQSLQIGPGAAPEATLYALKIFGASRESDIVIPAIEWAVDPNGDGDFSDHLDVINLSLGDALGASDGPEAEACGNAARAGAAVVASAGNNRDAYFISGTPASSPWAISVAASEDSDPSVTRLSPDRLAYFSSRGPAGDSHGVLLLKPDITAPGFSIRSAAAHAASPSALWQLNSGTSMAAPHIAGIMALLRQQRPDWAPQELKALLMNTAGFDVFSGANYGLPRFGPQRAGAGRADPEVAANGGVIAFSATHPERVSIAFEHTEVSGTLTENQTIRVWNKSGQTAAYGVSLDVYSAIPGVTVSATPPGTGAIAPGGFTDLTLTLHAEAAEMKHSRDPAADAVYGGNTRAWISEVSGQVLLTSGKAGNALRVPFYATLRPASNLSAEESYFDARPGGDSAITLTGQSLRTGDAPPNDEIALGGAYELLYRSPDEVASQGLDNAADIRFVGITSDYREQRAAGHGLDETTLYIAIAAHGQWYTPHWTQFFCYIDAGNDGRTDWGLYNSFLRSDAGAEGTNPDVFASILTDFGEEQTFQGFLNGYPAEIYDTVPFMTDIMVLPLGVKDLDLSEENPVIAFRVESLLYTDFLKVIDQAPFTSPGTPRRMFVYDITRPGITFSRPGGAVVFEAENAASIPIELDSEAYEAEGALGILLFQHHNPAGAHAQWVPVITSGDTDHDGLTDALESVDDADGDGLPNLADPDSDGDGIADAIEGAGDPDLDTIPNYLDLDSDGDGLSDAFEGAGDPDFDTIPNFLDLDSDGDGLFDAEEGADDPDLDSLPNYLDLDSDGDSLTDTFETDADADADTIPNYLDLDSDSDTLPDQAEALYGSDPYRKDSDDDGIPDADDGLYDADLDGRVNAVDDDSDDDGLLDLWEGREDPDGDGLPNFIDPDSDGDGIDDIEEGLRDPDEDGIPNYLDLDSDGDSLSDADETARFGTNPYSADTDQDGLRDEVELAQGTDPRMAQPPGAPVRVRASDGLYPDRVEITWDPLPGYIEYRVFRREEGGTGAIRPLGGGWQTGRVFVDQTAASPESIPGKGCHGASSAPVLNTYWVQARSAPLNTPPTAPGPLSAPEVGYRGP